MNTGKFSNDQTEGSERERLRAELQSLARQADGEPAVATVVPSFVPSSPEGWGSSFPSTSDKIAYLITDLG